MGRWIEKEQKGLDEMKILLSNKIATVPQYPEVVGDRRLIRFLRGNQHDVKKAVSEFNRFLAWRKSMNVDQIRQEIVYNGINSAYKFPHGPVILEVAPQIAITAKALDRKGRPIIHETYNFSPKVFKERITIDQYLLFLIYTLELRALILEELSEVREREYIKNNPVESERIDGYGVTVQVCNIRDLKGVGFAHIQADGRAIVASALKVGLPNYPDFLGIGIHVNVPWIFNTAWAFIKGLLDEDIISKIIMVGPHYKEVLEKHISRENIPKLLDGEFMDYNEPYLFNITEDSPLYYPGAPITSEYIPKRQPSYSTVPNNNNLTVIYESAEYEFEAAYEDSNKSNTSTEIPNGNEKSNDSEKNQEIPFLYDNTTKSLSILLGLIVILFSIFHSEKIIFLMFPMIIAIIFTKDV